MEIENSTDEHSLVIESLRLFITPVSAVASLTERIS